MKFKDGVIDYKASLPEDFIGNRVPYTENSADYVQWVHVEENNTNTISSNVTMTGSEPAITVGYTAVSGVTNGQVTDPKVVPIDVTAKIGGVDVTLHVIFEHEDCSVVPSCEWNNDFANRAKFLLHVRTGTLTIKKSGMYDHVYTNDLDEDHESAIFTITGPDGTTWKVTIPNDGSVTLINLQPGTYSVVEDDTWTWRYVKYSNDKVVVTSGSNTLSINNTQTNPYWLGGDNYRVNKFGIVNQNTTGN